MNLQTLEKAAVTNNSVVIHRGKILKDSCVSEAHFQKYQKPKFRLKYFFPIFFWSKKPHVLITDEWSKNYCHWLWEALTKLIILKEKFPDSFLVLPKSYLKIDFVTKSLAAFGFNKNNIRLIPKKSHTYLQNLSFIRCIGISTPNYYEFLKFNEVSRAIVSYYQNQLNINFGERIYISRNKPQTKVLRLVENEKELREMLTKYGFKTVYMENFSFLEQISIAANAKFIVASHGAGITNAMFAGAKCHLFELINKGWQNPSCFGHMCKKMQVFYQRFNCEEIFDDKKTMELRDIRVNVADLEQNLIKFLK